MRLFVCIAASSIIHVLVFFTFNDAAFSHKTESTLGRLQASINKRTPLPTEAHSEATTPPAEAVAEPLGSDSIIDPLNIAEKASTDSSVEDRYFVRSELSTPPSVRGPIDIQAPPTKLATPWKLVIRLYLSETGMVDRIKIEESSAPSYVEDDALIAFRNALYSPGKINGIAVKSQLLVQVVEP